MINSDNWELKLKVFEGSLPGIEARITEFFDDIKRQGLYAEIHKIIKTSSLNGVGIVIFYSVHKTLKITTNEIIQKFKRGNYFGL